MIKRWLVFTTCLLASGGLGMWAASKDGLVVGLLLGAFFWLALDSWYAASLVTWLREEQNNEIPAADPVTAPALPAVWGEIADRMRRVLKLRGEQYQESQARLEEFLAAMQASPSGVILLDVRGCIEWCNHMATRHFGFDAQRDLRKRQHAGTPGQTVGSRAFLWQRPQTTAVTRHHRGGTGGGDAPRFCG